MDDGMGTRFWLKTAGLIVGCVVAIVVGWLVFSSLFFRFGFIGAMLVLFAVLGLLAHRYDKKKERQYADEA
jgi:high-affinity Fe2+/Pb2+ permease